MALPIPSTSVSPQDRAIQLLQDLVDLYPILPEPHYGSIHNALDVANDPSIDVIFCESAGKVVHITVKFFAEIQQNESVAIRGCHVPLDWDTDPTAHSPVIQRSPNANQRTFTFPIPPAQMDDKIEFKLVLHKEGQLFWQKGNNCCIDLSQYGHIVKFNAGIVNFKETPG